MKRKLNNVTLVCIDCFNYGNAISAIKKSLVQLEFAEVLFLTDIEAYSRNFPFTIVKIPKISNKAEYSRFVMKELYKHINTDYVLIIQHDGYVLNGNAWSDEFFDYDVVAPAWLYVDGRNCGCGGFTLRTKHLLQILGTDDFIEITDVEDDNIGRLYRGYLEKKYGIKFAPDDVCDRFGFELREPTCPTLGFHGDFHKPYKKTVIVKRSAALGDIVATEPLLDYYNKKGYNVVIDMPIHLSMFFGAHFFPIKHISQIDGRIADKALKIDLDGSYENNPAQLHLKSYYDAAGITDGEIRNPKLRFAKDDQMVKLFKKYCVIHIDERDQPSRNIYGVDWERIATELSLRGYIPIQVGQRQHEEIDGAIQMQTVTTHFLLWLVSGADLFIGVDSGVSNMAVASGIPSVIFSGSVAPEYIYPDISKIQIVSKEKCCDKWRCWHSEPGNTTGVECYIDADVPPCTQYTTEEALSALDKAIS